MASFQEFRDSVIAYLKSERDFIKADIAEHKTLEAEKLEELGLLVRKAKFIASHEGMVRYRTEVNWTKLRPGDEVKVRDLNSCLVLKGVVEENAVEEILLSLPDGYSPEEIDIEVIEIDNLDMLIGLAEKLQIGAPGVGFVKTLAGISAPMKAGFGRITDFKESEIPASFNPEQRKAVRMAIDRPSIAYVQGTPGSGKTHLLSVIAKIFATRGKDVVVMALTHQAVNNALNKIVSLGLNLPVVKIGKEFKNLGLDEHVLRNESFTDYLKTRSATGRFFGGAGNIVGMTFQSAIINLGERKSAFIPQIILFDEAGQMPLTHAAVIGAFKCGSVMFIGDDAQMPPIYHEKLENEALSRSIFEHVKRLYQDSGVVLNLTYRMNNDITQFVGQRYYAPRGINLVSAECSAERHLDYPSVEYVTCKGNGSADENPFEAKIVVEIVKKYASKGVPYGRMAVITPFRRQVRTIRQTFLEDGYNREDLPLIDTVERLQGQDVDVIILSFAADSPLYIASQQSFLMNKNRLNVMFSRATMKVVVVMSKNLASLF